MANPSRNMPLFSETITEFWQTRFLNGEVIHQDDYFTVTINPDLSEDRRVMVLETVDGRVLAVLTPALGEKLQLKERKDLSEEVFRQKLSEAGILLHGADYLFYFTEDEKNALMAETVDDHLCQLTEADAEVFAEFKSSASEQDLDDAYVELDHWAVFGSFEQNRLASVTSMYPWEEAKLADLGVLTLPTFRGKGHARDVVRAICQYAYKQGYDPQYRCQLDNEASAALAKAVGLTLFGKWEVISPDSTN